MRNRFANKKLLRRIYVAGIILAVPAVALIFVSKVVRAVVSDELFRVNVPYALNATQGTRVFLEIAQTGSGAYKDAVKLDAPEVWSKYYVDADRIDTTVLGIYNGGYGGETDVLGSRSGSVGERFPDSSKNLPDSAAVRFDYYLAEDTAFQGIPDERPCKDAKTDQNSPSATRYSSQMPTEGWYKDLTAKQFLDHSFCNGQRWHATKKSGKYVIFVKASWTTPAPVDSTGRLGRLNAFKIGAAYTDGSLSNKFDNPITGYWSNPAAATRSSEPTTAAYSVQDRISKTGTQGDYEFGFAADCRLAVGQSEQRFLHWKDIDYPDYYKKTDPIPEFTLVDIDETGREVKRTTVRGDQQLNGTTVFNGEGVENKHNFLEFTGKGGHKYRWEWKNITRIDGIRLWLPYDDYGYYRGCGSYEQNIHLKAGNGGTTSDSTTPFRARGGDTVGAYIDEKYVPGRTGQVPTGPTTLTVSSVPGGPAVNKAFDSGKMSVPLGGETLYNDPSTGLLTTRWTFQGLGPGKPWDSSRKFTTYYTLKEDAPDGAKYCFDSTTSPESNIHPDKVHSNQVCMIIDNSLRPFVRTSGADVHAGNCKVNGVEPVTGNGKITAPQPTSLGSYGSYIVSANDAITNFGSGGSVTSKSLTFGKSGRYGPMCRPTITDMGKDIANTKTVSSPFDLSRLTGPGSIQFAGGGSGIVTGISRYPITVYAPNGTVTINGASFGGKTDLPTAKADLPVTGVIAQNIKISKDTTAITALLYARDTIDTCYEVPDLSSATNVATCKNALFLNGFAMARDFSLKRTRAGLNGLQPSEILGFNAAFYLNPPQGFRVATDAVKYQGERAPLY